MIKSMKKFIAVIASASLLMSSIGAMAETNNDNSLTDNNSGEAIVYNSDTVGITNAVQRYVETMMAKNDMLEDTNMVADAAAGDQAEEVAEVENDTEASEISSEETAVLSAGTSEENSSEVTELTTEATTEKAEEPKTESTVKYPQYVDRAVATVSGTLNIRAEKSTDSEKVGTLTRGGICLVKEKGSEWTYIASGNCKGYVKTQYLAFGDDAGAWCEANGVSKYAKINASGLRVRKDASESSDIITIAPQDETYRIISSADGWTKIELDGSTDGYVKSDYILVVFEAPRAETVEETKAKEEAKTEAKTEATTEKVTEKESEKSTEKATEATTEKKTEATTEKATEAQTSAPAGGSGSQSKQDLVNYALQFVGNPYVYGGNSLTNGTDCSGFTMLLYKEYGVSLPHSASAQSKYGTEISVSDVQPGDLLFYSKNGSINHVALYIGNGQVVHASSPSTGIKISNYNYRSPVKAVRLMD